MGGYWRILVVGAVGMAIALCSCRTTEANYRAAYEQAVAQREDTSGIDNTIYDKIRREAVSSSVVNQGDTIPARRERVKVTEGDSKLQAAYVVVGQFKQIFNARSLCKRLKDNGYTDAVILETREPLYYVAAGGGDAGTMAEMYRKVAADGGIPMREPYPIILQPAQSR